MLRILGGAAALALLAGCMNDAGGSAEVESCFNNHEAFVNQRGSGTNINWSFNPEKTADGWCSIFEPKYVSALNGTAFKFEYLEWRGRGLDRTYQGQPLTSSPEVRVIGGDRLTAEKIARFPDPVIRALLSQAL